MLLTAQVVNFSCQLGPFDHMAFSETQVLSFDSNKSFDHFYFLYCIAFSDLTYSMQLCTFNLIKLAERNEKKKYLI